MKTSLLFSLGVLLLFFWSSCKHQRNVREDEPSSALNDQAQAAGNPPAGKGAQKRPRLSLATYQYQSDGTPRPDHGRRHYYLSSGVAQGMSQPPAALVVDAVLESYLKDAGIIQASLSSPLRLKDKASKKAPPAGCYYALYIEEYGIFFLDPYKRIEPLLSRLPAGLKSSLSGLSCNDEQGEMWSFASSNFFGKAEEGLQKFSELLGRQGLELVPADKDLALWGFFEKKVDITPTGGKTSVIPRSKSFFDGEALKKYSCGRCDFTKKADVKPDKQSLAESMLKDLSTAGIIFTPGVKGRLEDGSELFVGEKLGQGGYGTVYDVTISRDGVEERYAAKIFESPVDLSFRTELGRTKGSPYFLQNYGFSLDGRIQLMERGRKSILEEVESGKLGGQDPEAFLSRGEMFHDIFDGLSVLHEKTWRSWRESKAHWDLKPENLLRGYDERIKIIDLDEVSTAVNIPHVGTRDYMSPEYAKVFYSREKSAAIDGTKSDIFATGVMLFETKYSHVNKGANFSSLMVVCCRKIVGEVTIKNQWENGDEIFANPEDVVRGLREYGASLPEGSDKEEIAVLADMLNPDAKLRPSAVELKRRWELIHPRFPSAQVDASQVFR
jgi:hypothetical protein